MNKMLSLLSKLSKESISNSLNLKDVKIKTIIKDGILTFEPFTIKTGASHLILGGRNSLTGILDYKGSYTFTRKGEQKSLYFNASGKYDDMKIKLLNKEGKTVKEQTKDNVETAKTQIQTKVDEKKEELKNELKSKAEKSVEDSKDKVKNKLQEALLKKG